MWSFLTQVKLEDFTQDYLELTQKNLKGLDNLKRVKEEDIQCGVSEKEAVYREDKIILYHFKPVVEKPFEIPLLMVYALVNRPYMVDLQEGRSLVANLLKLGLDIYLIDWGYPTRSDRWLTLDDYINGYVDNCVDFIRQSHHLDKINLLGICQGGTFSLCYSSLYPDKIKNLVTMVTPVDFYQTETLLNMRGGCSLGAEALDIDLMVDSMGNIPGDFLNLEFLELKPLQLGYQKYLDFPDIMEDESKLVNFLRMEKWIFDSPDQAGESYRQFLKDFYQQNKLIKGEVMLGDKRVDLHNLTMPILNLYADKDHLVPPASSLALGNYIGTSDYTACAFPVGHIGMYVSGKVQRDLPPAISDWLKARA
ncbi:MAG: class III poly(R)-hydroxyalkanoic acid synthase subunit PhaC [Microcystis sp. M015S2]|uniref:class III poly(R)-hydroxyalkanoic acid synthase subunit PhaC n=1 Tax=unclassified Microcystis TaxID=2643300 RepID=UPI002587A08F|nr:MULTISPECIES: class III poly(R)-hydroxyalkanoic acid synthase subunit PhaC [unclassified Microcystis]MCA2711436.1 class III poly(R)-hydroxyalkanoic acid synthase subunit PhaC [Microcystis sp. M025S2]MCA2743542.1 class III poly(R)-hydroxyalkanoic acid synthase subunit PhaC [Microcystis sp. M015S2]MCA2761129.1 class III poly(R)-hydroxyalkanoic acid synthase subunit PhaC [Microcystis sp. M145S2]